MFLFSPLSSRGSVTCACEKEGEVGNGHVCPGEVPIVYTVSQGTASRSRYNNATSLCRRPIVSPALGDGHSFVIGLIVLLVTAAAAAAVGPDGDVVGGRRNL